MKNILTKDCIVCGKKFAKPKSCGLPEWNNRRKFCSQKCSNGWKKGKHFSIKTEFKKGQKAINPIKKGEHKGKNTEFKKGNNPWNKGMKASKEWYEKMEKAGFLNTGRFKEKRLAEKAGNWKGGITKLRISIMSLNKYKKWRTAVFQRDRHTCQKCGARRKKGDRVVIQAHHLKSFYKILAENKIRTTQDALKCNELWDISNGQTLCISCHRQTDSYLVNQHTL